MHLLLNSYIQIFIFSLWRRKKETFKNAANLVKKMILGINIFIIQNDAAIFWNGIKHYFDVSLFLRPKTRVRQVRDSPWVQILRGTKNFCNQDKRYWMQCFKISTSMHCKKQYTMNKLEIQRQDSTLIVLTVEHDSTWAPSRVEHDSLCGSHPNPGPSLSSRCFLKWLASGPSLSPFSKEPPTDTSRGVAVRTQGRSPHRKQLPAHP